MVPKPWSRPLPGGLYQGLRASGGRSPLSGLWSCHSVQLQPQPCLGRGSLCGSLCSMGQSQAAQDHPSGGPPCHAQSHLLFGDVLSGSNYHRGEPGLVRSWALEVRVPAWSAHPEGAGGDLQGTAGDSPVPVPVWAEMPARGTKLWWVSVDMVPRLPVGSLSFIKIGEALGGRGQLAGDGPCPVRAGGEGQELQSHGGCASGPLCCVGSPG